MKGTGTGGHAGLPCAARLIKVCVAAPLRVTSKPTLGLMNVVKSTMCRSSNEEKPDPAVACACVAQACTSPVAGPRKPALAPCALSKRSRACVLVQKFGQPVSPQPGMLGAMGPAGVTGSSSGFPRTRLDMIRSSMLQRQLLGQNFVCNQVERACAGAQHAAAPLSMVPTLQGQVMLDGCTVRDEQGVSAVFRSPSPEPRT